MNEAGARDSIDPAAQLRPAVYLALGDSFTIATGVGAQRAFPAVLVRRWRERGIDVELTNPSANGYTTDALIERELPLAGRVRPTLVTLLIGANDIVRGSSADRYRSQLSHILRALRAAGVPESGLVALPQPDWSLSPAASAFGVPAALRRAIERFNGVAKEEVELAGGTYVDLFPLMRRQAEAGMVAPDSLHPSAEAHAEWAAALEETLLQAVLPSSAGRPVAAAERL